MQVETRHQNLGAPRGDEALVHQIRYIAEVDMFKRIGKFISPFKNLKSKPGELVATLVLLFIAIAGLFIAVLDVVGYRGFEKALLFYRMEPSWQGTHKNSKTY
jgi:hypothetical protein